MKIAGLGIAGFGIEFGGAHRVYLRFGMVVMTSQGSESSMAYRQCNAICSGTYLEKLF